MKRTEIRKLYENAQAYTEGTVKVCGWIRTNRDSKVLGFMEINDGSCFKGVQVVFEKDMLFATLETTIRKITPPGKSPFYLSDTVGFIDKLPHNLVDAFRSTLEEACEADLLLQVVDVSDPYYKDQMRVTNETLAELATETLAGIPLSSCSAINDNPVSL